MGNQKEWDKYFLGICEAVAKNSKCLSRQIGAILVKENSIISTGYNGPPRGIKRCDERWFSDRFLAKRCEELNFTQQEIKDKCPRYVLGYKSGQGLDLCLAGHAERNVLINAARHGISTNGLSLYMTCGIPCKDCLIEIINAGIKEVVVTSKTNYDKQSDYLLENSNLIVRVYSHL
jgi:dCMP deaminase